MVSVAGSRPIGAAVNQGIGDRDAVISLGTQNNVLATNACSSDVINPDQVGIVEGDGIATPDVLGVEIRNSNVLDDNVLGTANHANAFTLDGSGGPLSNERLVGVDDDAEDAGLVTEA